MHMNGTNLNVHVQRSNMYIVKGMHLGVKLVILSACMLE